MDAAAGVGLSHRRLSVVDLSQHGRQPMVFLSGRYVISFHGEIYHHRELRGKFRSRRGTANSTSASE